MPRLPRRHIPLEVRCRVALRQLGELLPDQTIKEWRKIGLGQLLADRLPFLAHLLGSEGGPSDLHLDHHPALALRQQVKDRRGKIIGYIPDEHDVDCLIYRTRVAHLVKTNHHGDGAQHPDRVLIKKERRRQKMAAEQRTKRPAFAKAKRELRSASLWPKGQKIQGRPFGKKRGDR